MRPVLKTALRRLWRDDTTLQLGADPASALVLTGLDARQARALRRLDGSRDTAAWLAAAEADGLSAVSARRLLRSLAAGGLLDDAEQPLGALAALPPPERDRLAPDHAALALRSREPGTAARVLDARARAGVEVHGAGRVGATVAALLAAAGVGRVVPVDPGRGGPADACPGGAGADRAEAGRQRAAASAVQRVAPSCLTEPGPRPPDLVVLAGGWPAARPAAALLREARPHLLACVVDGRGVVGPLVLPGASACVRCLDLHRTDRDPAWPRLAAQLESPDPSPACDVVLATLVAALAAAQALQHLDGEGVPAAVDGTLELGMPAASVRRRHWPAHPACGCGWRLAEADATMAG